MARNFCSQARWACEFSAVKPVSWAWSGGAAERVVKDRKRTTSTGNDLRIGLLKLLRHYKRAVNNRSARLDQWDDFYFFPIRPVTRPTRFVRPRHVLELRSRWRRIVATCWTIHGATALFQ